MPEIQRKLFKEIRYTKGEKITELFTKMEHAKMEFERHAWPEDKQIKVSSDMMGHLCLEHSGLHESEHTHVLRLTGFTTEYNKIKRVLGELYPCGSYRTGPPLAKGKYSMAISSRSILLDRF